MKKWLISISLVPFFLNVFAGILAGEEITFLSTQLRPAKEARVLREEVLSKFPKPITFLPADDRAFFFGITASDKLIPTVMGALHGEFAELAPTDYFYPLDSLVGQGNHLEINQQFVELGRMKGKQVFLPWMQATYLMAAHKKALAYLPVRVDLNHLTYDQLLDWAVAMRKDTGSPRLGFPAGEDGLLHRFFQGYLYPSFTGMTVRGFQSKDAQAMWIWFSQLWQEVTTHSMTYRSMAEPLLTGEVWVAWDHTARLAEALERNPEDFVVFPAPIGPKGRGFMVVLAGLGIPKKSKNIEDGKELIKFLISPESQATIMSNTGFFPVRPLGTNSNIPPGLAQFQEAVAIQSSGKQALPVMLPVGLGSLSKEFNVIYSTAFSKIVVRRQDPAVVLPDLAMRLSKILSEANASCWPPDKASQGPCPVQ